MKLFPLAVVAFAVPCGTALADETFRCGKYIVTSELTVQELTKRCGQPTLRETSSEDVRVRNQYGLVMTVGETVTEKWTFDRGTRAAPMVVTIIDGKIKSIERKK